MGAWTNGAVCGTASCCSGPTSYELVEAVESAVSDALAEVSSSDLGHALVVSDGRLIGLLATSDLARVLDARPRGRQGLGVRRRGLG